MPGTPGEWQLAQHLLDLPLQNNVNHHLLSHIHPDGFHMPRFAQFYGVLGAQLHADHC